MSQGHNPASVSFTSRATPSSVVFTERSASATAMLEPLRAKKRSDGFWLFLSGLADGTMFSNQQSRAWRNTPWMGFIILTLRLVYHLS